MRGGDLLVLLFLVCVYVGCTLYFGVTSLDVPLFKILSE